ncbi:MAG TPA: GNAT family N-acetyltransferase [Candidatus Limnocylindrales bacterium]|nr:GNAT family N-acetyltransferase [Candidatus Limnocylindrales bacterium]
MTEGPSAADDPRVDPADVRPELVGRPPLAVAPVVLEGSIVRLEPLSLAHVAGLAEVGLDPAVWRWVTIDVRTRGELEAWVREALAEEEAGTSLPFATIDRASGRAVGSTRYLNIDRRNRHVEIGWTWVAPGWQRSGANREAKLLMVGHAFDTLGCLRVEFKTDSLNDQSRAALLGIGATFEGIFRNHVISQGGRIRHSAWYSVTDREWPAVRDRLEASLRR